MAKMIEPPDTTVSRIYQLYEAAPEARSERPYLGASILGAECTRQLWYTFRWAYYAEPPQGRVLRLFDDGHREEARVIDELRRIGVEVFGAQSGFKELGGHLSGHIDGVASHVPEAPKTMHILEIKTHNDKSFKDLLRSRVKISKPQHYAQMMLYMHYLNYKRALYIAVNKNDSMIYSERIPYNAGEAGALVLRAATIIRADHAPPKLHEDPTRPSAYACLWCASKSICHDNQPARRNCRTCISATAIIDDSVEAKWHCNFWNKNLTLEEQAAGCPAHLYLPSLVPALEQVDADPEQRLISYKMKDGSIWIDGKPAK
jgi:hypothetical protein